jgi:hypothetical protein
MNRTAPGGPRAAPRYHCRSILTFDGRYTTHRDA